jgi:hypothetical protein
LIISSFYIEGLLYKTIFAFFAVIIIFVKKLHLYLNKSERKIFYFFIFIYPLIELILKFITQEYNLNYDLFLAINSLEHVLAGTMVGIILYAFIKPTLEKLNYIEKIFFFIPITVFFCLIYELLGFFFFYQSINFQVYNLYGDTMRDLSMNIIGAFISFIIIVRKN